VSLFAMLDMLIMILVSKSHVLAVPGGDVSLRSETYAACLPYSRRMNRFEPIDAHRLAAVGSLLAEPARAAIILALMDGTSRPASELARRAAVAPATASAHLRKLCDGRVLSVVPQGRHRYFRIAGEEAAHLVEALSLMQSVIRPADTARAFDPALRNARTCYRHLAGRLGVTLFEAMSARGGFALSSGAIALSDAGKEALIGCGLFDASDLADPLEGRPCIDWSERRHHLAGPLGTLLTQRLFERGWLRKRRDSRAVIVSAKGERAFDALGVRLDQGAFPHRK
jgi:DNA-binding transcriptional ArsR family regulator